MVGVNSSYSTTQNDAVLFLKLLVFLLEGCLLPYTCTNQTRLISSLVFFLCLLHAIYSILLSRFLFTPYLCFIFRLPLCSRFVVQVSPSSCNVFPVCFLKLHRSLAESVWFSLYRFGSCTGFFLKIFSLFASQKSMKLSGVSFPGISLEDSLAILGTNILSFSQVGRFVLLLFQSFGIFYLCSASFRFCPTGVLLKPSGFLCTGFLKMQCFFLLLFRTVGIFYLSSASFRFCSTRLLLKPSAFLYMRTETMSLSDVSFPGISLHDSPTIVGTNITFVAEHETNILNGLLMFQNGGFCTRFLKMQCFFCYFFDPSVFSIYVLLRFGFVPQVCWLKPSGFLYMRTETMSLSDISFPGISLDDSPSIVGTNIVFFS
ncbi:hypothetical protein LXL04_008296 [Taraxacum kok-saghyz]